MNPRCLFRRLGVAPCALAVLLLGGITNPADASLVFLNGFETCDFELQGYPDLDEDNYGDETSPGVLFCGSLPEGFVLNAEDCDDTSALISPDQIDVCDAADNNCDGLVDEEYSAGGSVTYSSPNYPPDDGKVLGDPCGVGACASGTVTCGTDEASLICSTDALAEPEQCDGVDNDCDGQIDEGCCSDGLLNGQETDIDCGGPVCHACEAGQSCLLDRDCSSENCFEGFCSAAVCGDGFVDPGENCDDFNADACGTCSADCRTPHPGAFDCPAGTGCAFDEDCLSGVCEFGICADLPD